MSKSKRVLSLILAIFLLLTFSLAGCKKKKEQEKEPTTQTATKNPDGNATEEKSFILASKLSDDVKGKIDNVLNSFFSYYEEDNVTAVANLFSSDFNATEEQTREFFNSLHENTENPFIRHDGYYLSGIETGEDPISVKHSLDDKNYIELVPRSSELYCALYVAEGKYNSYMLALILVPEGGDFKIAYINPGDYKFNGENAEQVYKDAKAYHDSSKILPAYIESCKLGYLRRPAGYYRYSKDSEMGDFFNNLYIEMAEKYPLPLELEGTGSAIYEIGVSKNDEHGMIPLFLFTTDIPISDKKAVTAQAERVLSAIEKKFPGFSDAFEYAQFNATNDELDDSTTSVTTEPVVLKLK